MSLHRMEITISSLFLPREGYKGTRIFEDDILLFVEKVGTKQERVYYTYYLFRLNKKVAVHELDHKYDIEEL